MEKEILGYAPDLPGDEWSERDRQFLAPFATNPDGFISVLRNLPPEIVGALCSRASRASGSLLKVLLDEYIYPILDGEDRALAGELEETVAFLTSRGFRNILNNQRAQAFYAKWLSQYGDDSIAQVTGTHVLFRGVSQVAMKFIEDQRIGLEPIEQSTRYVQFGKKVNGRYRYYIPHPDLERIGLPEEYRATLDHLFDVYVALQEPLIRHLKENYEEKDSVLEKKAFDTLRGLLPLATMGQVAFRGNAQAFEYLINRLAKNGVGEFRWIAGALKTELDHEIPSLLLRVNDPKSGEYQAYLAERGGQTKAYLTGEFDLRMMVKSGCVEGKPAVKLVGFDSEAEEKIVAGILFPLLHHTWDDTLAFARRMDAAGRREVLLRHFAGRTARWQKVGRAFESSYLRFEIAMNIGAYRDLHRHRMMTQERQLFTVNHGYDMPAEVAEAGLEPQFREALERAAELWRRIAGGHGEHELAQYVVPMAYRMRFYQWQNFRQLFWEAELRTTPQGHPDYRWIEQEKHRLVAEKFPLLAEFMLVDRADYPFARRGTEEKIKAKEAKLIDELGRKTV